MPPCILAGVKIHASLQTDRVWVVFKVETQWMFHFLIFLLDKS